MAEKRIGHVEQTPPTTPTNSNFFKPFLLEKKNTDKFLVKPCGRTSLVKRLPSFPDGHTITQDDFKMSSFRHWTWPARRNFGGAATWGRLAAGIFSTHMHNLPTHGGWKWKLGKNTTLGMCVSRMVKSNFWIERLENHHPATSQHRTPQRCGWFL